MVEMHQVIGAHDPDQLGAATMAFDAPDSQHAMLQAKLILKG